MSDDTQPLTILVVEDNPGDLFLLGEFLRSTDLDIGGDYSYESDTLTKIDDVLARIRKRDLDDPSGWRLDNEVKVSQLRKDVETLRERTAELPGALLGRS